MQEQTKAFVFVFVLVDELAISTKYIVQVKTDAILLEYIL